MLTILRSLPNVKIFKTKNHIERERAAKPAAELLSDSCPKRAIYRAICLEPGCGWTWRSANEPHDAIHHRTRAQGHTSARSHRTRTVFDIVGQEDLTFIPRAGARDTR